MTGQDVLSTAPENDTLRKQLMQAQRLSSIGELASSMAHEFNNVLTTILNYAKIGVRTTDLETANSACEKVLKSGQRAAAIVQGIRRPMPSSWPIPVFFAAV